MYLCIFVLLLIVFHFLLRSRPIRGELLFLLSHTFHLSPRPESRVKITAPYHLIVLSKMSGTVATAARSKSVSLDEKVKCSTHLLLSFVDGEKGIADREKREKKKTQTVQLLSFLRQKMFYFRFTELQVRQKRLSVLGVQKCAALM